MAHYGVYGVYGVYGAWCQNGRVVAIRKARGPYTGMLDLPGGSPEGDETSEETLLRELHEECGVTDVHVFSWHPFDVFVSESSTGEPVNSNHRGLIALVRVLDDVKPIENVEDVRGVELIDPRDHSESEFTPPLLLAVTLLKDHGLLRSSGVSEPT